MSKSVEVLADEKLARELIAEDEGFDGEGTIQDCGGDIYEPGSSGQGKCI